MIGWHHVVKPCYPGNKRGPKALSEIWQSPYAEDLTGGTVAYAPIFPIFNLKNLNFLD